MSQIVKRAIQNNAVDGDKIKLLNNQSLKGLNASGVDVNLFKIDSSNAWVFEALPKFGTSNIATVQNIADEVALEASARAVDISGVNSAIGVVDGKVTALTGRVTTIEGDLNTAVTGLKARVSTVESGLSSEITNRIADVNAEEAARIAADNALQSQINAAASALNWREKVLLISDDAELRAAAEAALLSAILPFGDDEAPILPLASIPVGAFLIARNGASSKLMKVYDDAGTKKVTFLGFDALADGDTFIVANDLIDSPAGQEGSAIYSFSNGQMLKLGDFDFSVASGIDLSSAYVQLPASPLAITDSVEQALGKLEGQITEAVGDAADAFALAGVQDGRLDILEPKVVTIEGQLNTPVTGVVAMVADHESRIDVLEPKVSAIEASYVKKDGSVALTGTLSPAVTKTTSLGTSSFEYAEVHGEFIYGSGAVSAAVMQSDIIRARGGVGVTLAFQNYGEFNFGSKLLRNVLAPSVGTDAANMAYVDAKFAAVDMSAYIPLTQKAAPNGVATLDGAGKIPATQLPSYVDDVLEFANLAAFPVTGETGKMYVALDSNKVYRWSGSVYIYITSGAVDSVNGKNGVVTLNSGEIPEGTNLYYTQARFNTAFALKTTTDLAEGTNLYFTTARARSAAVVNTLAGSEIDQAPSVSSVKAYVTANATKVESVIIVLSPADITNQFITVASVSTKVIDVTPKGYLAQFEGDDYSVSYLASTTRITFLGDMTSLVSGDKVRVTYTK